MKVGPAEASPDDRELLDHACTLRCVIAYAFESLFRGVFRIVTVLVADRRQAGARIASITEQFFTVSTTTKYLVAALAGKAKATTKSAASPYFRIVLFPPWLSLLMPNGWGFAARFGRGARPNLVR
jgi:hypothetical protein